MEDKELKTDCPPQRLCSEIQLFDLCNLSSCRFKDGRFCSSSDLLERFEKIAEEEQRSPERYIDEESEDKELSDDDGYGDYDNDEGDGWEEDE